MKVIELLKICRVLLETLQRSCIKTSDVKYIDLFEDYLEMASQKEKVSYISSVLSQKYGISERQFFYIIRRFQQNCKILAVE